MTFNNNSQSTRSLYHSHLGRSSVVALLLLRAALSMLSLSGTHVDQPFVVCPSLLSRRMLSVQLDDDVGVEAAAGADALLRANRSSVLASSRGRRLGDDADIRRRELAPQSAQRPALRRSSSEHRGRLDRAPGCARRQHGGQGAGWCRSGLREVERRRRRMLLGCCRHHGGCERGSRGKLCLLIYVKNDETIL